MARLTAVAAALAVMANAATDPGITTSSTIGPSAFMWPEDRVWSADADNTPPCGSIASVQNRTDFPMQNGRIALVAQDESYDLVLSISYLEEPKSNDDFNELVSMETFKDLKLGHTCVNLPNPPDTVKAGANATLQIKYIADFDKPENQTFYACSDITYVPITDFKAHIPCFNATQDTPEGDKGGESGKTGDTTQTPTPTPSKKSGLSGGAIAGIVIGSIAGVGLIAAAALIIFRRKQQRIRVLRQQNSERSKWDNAARDSQSQSSVRMNNL